MLLQCSMSPCGVVLHNRIFSFVLPLFQPIFFFLTTIVITYHTFIFECHHTCLQHLRIREDFLGEKWNRGNERTLLHCLFIFFSQSRFYLWYYILHCCNIIIVFDQTFRCTFMLSFLFLICSISWWTFTELCFLIYFFLSAILRIKEKKRYEVTFACFFHNFFFIIILCSTQLPGIKDNSPLTRVFFLKTAWTHFATYF